MADLFGFHEIELHPGVSPEEFEKFMAEVAQTAIANEGWKLWLLRGERGVRSGRYMVVLEIESVAARDRYSPSADGPHTDEAEELYRRNAALWDRWRQLATFPGENTVYTDYVVKIRQT